VDAHLFERVLERREHAEAEQVDLDDAEIGAVLLVPLHDAAADHRRRLDRHHLVEPAGRDHDAARVLPEMPRQAAHAAHEVLQRGDLRRGGVDAGRAQRRVGAAAVVRVLDALEQRGDPLRRVLAEAEHLAHLAHRHARAIGDDHRGHRGAVPPVFLEHVLDHLLALVSRREVEVDVGPFPALFGEKALEEQAHGDGVHRGDAERITDRAVGGGTASLHQHRCLAGEAHDVVHDQEVAREVELLDHRQLVLELAARTRRDGRAVALARAVLGEDAQERRLGLARRDRKLREAVAQVRERERAPLGDRARGADPGGAVGEALRHLFPRVQMLLGVAGEQAPHAIEPGLLAQADERIGEHAPVGSGVADVAGGHDGNARGLGQVHGAAIAALLLAPAVPRHVDPQALREQRTGAVEQRGCQSVVAARERAQVRGVLLHLGPGGERFSFFPARMAARDQAREIAIAARRLDQQLERRGPAILHRDVQIGADDRPHAESARRCVEARDPVDAVAVGHRERAVALLRRGKGQIFRIGRGLEERECAAAAQLHVVAGRGTRAHDR
jgi:hypothetical protein